MIKLQDMTPDVYYNQSRDFQFIGRLYDIVLNSVKTNADLIKECPLSMNTDEKLIDLMSLTLGFKSKHNYNVKQLTALCSAFCEIIKNKGSLYSIELATKTLFSAESVRQEFEYDLSEDNTEITIYVPEELTDLNLFRDLLNYILPAGMRCTLIRTTLIKAAPTDQFISTDNIDHYIVSNTQAFGGALYQEQSEGSNLYNQPLTNGNDFMKHIYSNVNIMQGTPVVTQVEVEPTPQQTDTTESNEEEEINNG